MLGVEGENKACDYLRDNGFQVLYRNYRKTYGEIDIICRAKDLTLVFVEVKTLRSPKSPDMRENLVPEDNLTSAKLNKLRKTCTSFANANPGLIFEDAGWRVDLLALTKYENSFDIKHYENIT